MFHHQENESLMPLLFLNQAANKWLPFLLIILLPIWKELYKRLLDMEFKYFKTRYILKATFSYRNGEFQISDCSDSFKAVMYDITSKLTHSKNWKYMVYDTTYDSFKMVEFAKPFPVTDTITVTLDKVVENIEKREHNYKVEKFTLSLFPLNNDMQSIKSYIEQIKKDYDAYSTAKALKTQKIFILNQFSHDDRINSYPHFTKLNFESNKTFDNLFFEGKDALLKKLDYFIHNKHTYNTLGIPYTMGMLFHGEPGTGKTSTIKAIANYTNRHVIILSTKYIKTYNQLKECLINEFINDYRIPYDKRIYVIEEIDCSSWGPIVCKRGESAAEKPPAPTPTQEDWTKVLEAEPATADSTQPAAAGAALSLLKKNELTITLSDLLELLDGIVEIPGRMVIFTTNHPDKLDPALLRPGRVDINLCFKKLNRQDVARLYHLWFKEELDTSKLKDYQYTQAELGELFSFHGTAAKNKLLY